MADGKRIRRSKKEVIEAGIQQWENKIKTYEKKIENAKSEIESLKKEKSQIEKKEKNDSNAANMKRLEKLIKDKGVSFEEVEAMLTNKDN